MGHDYVMIDKQIIIKINLNEILITLFQLSVRDEQ